MICADPDSFCKEIGENLCVIGQEVRPSEAVPDRIDILAIDEDGNAVVIELKRGTHKLQLLQAVSYAGMVSRWSIDRFVETLGASSSQSNEDARGAIEDHTDGDVSSINNGQRILLIAEDFDPAVLVATEWLHENYGVDIRCYRLQLSQENSSDYLTCTCIYPPIEIAALTRRAERNTEARASIWTDWPEALKPVRNAAVLDFFNSELASKQENRLRYRELIYRIDDKRRYWVACRAEYAYVRQGGRFPGDEEYWRKLISKPSSISKRKGVSGHSLRFHLATSADFAAFKKAILGKLTTIEYSPTPDDDPSEAEE